MPVEILAVLFWDGYGERRIRYYRRNVGDARGYFWPSYPWNYIRGGCLLKVQAPEIHRSLLKFKPKLPSRPALMPAPNQDRFASIFVDEID